jgi:hypothetical protein
MPFWLEKPAVLVSADVIPNMSQDYVERLNAMVRLSLVVAVLLAVISADNRYLLIAPVIMGLSVYLYNNRNSSLEKFIAKYNGPVLPTADNPFGNFNKITDDRSRLPAAKSWDNKAVQRAMEEAFNVDLFRDAGDLFHRENEQRQFYQMPVTDAMPDTVGFAKALYSTDPTCKENGTYCVR